MPHFIIDCSPEIILQKTPETIMRAVHDTANVSGLFVKNDIKVRINMFQHFMLGEDKKDFIHVFGNIMEGRTTEEKAALSKSIIQKLNELFPDISILSINIRDFEKATYCNKSLIDPDNVSGDRHFSF